MGKNKQQQRPKRKKPLKTGQHDKAVMKEVLQQLAQSKANNAGLTGKLSSIALMSSKHKNIHKKNRKDSKVEDKDSEIENEVEEQVNKPTVNIFAVDNFVSEKPVIVNNTHLDNSSRMEDEVDLESKARRVMGENFNVERFGDKPLKIIEQNNEPLVLSEDEDQPNSIKTITHPNIKIPEGSKRIVRRKQIEQIRQKLPIYMKQQEIVETVNTHLVTLICGETGSGKSTQLPQFLAEKNYETLGKIAITQPRRLATVSLARRVADEMNCKIGAQVAYQVRHELKQSKQSYIKFMTDGILLKEMSSDPLLLTYGVIIIDEAHERKLNTDILIGLLSRLILVRYKMSLQGKCNPLRLIIMSATLRVSDFQNEKLFNFQVPILRVEAKMYPVTIFHERNTPSSYVDCAVKKCVKIQKQLPQGDVLVFLTGKEEIHQMAIKLEMELGRLQMQVNGNSDHQPEDDDEEKVEGEYIDEEKPSRKNSTVSDHNPVISSFVVYKLYSSLPTEQQDKVFKMCEPGTRKFIISTNIAQTSITVPNIRYVIDSGQEKHRYFDGVWKWSKGWGSKAMAAQRSGRAGRTTHGYCYRLYSSALYANIMEEHPAPEITKLPLESVVLEVKAIGFSNIFSFPFPSPPTNQALKLALDNLIQVGAIEGEIGIRSVANPQYNPEKQEDEQNKVPKTIKEIVENCKVTELGKIISFIPLAPRLSKMILLGRQFGLEKQIVLIAVLLTIESIFRVQYNKMPDLEEPEINDNSKSMLKQKLVEMRRSELNQFKEKYSKYIDKDCGSDLFVTMNIVGDFLQEVYKHHHLNKSRSAQQNIQSLIISESNRLQLNSNVMREFYYNCDQITEIYETLTSQKIDLSQYKKPTPSEYSSLLSILLSTFVSNICRLEQNNKYRNKDSDLVYVHRMSMLYKNQSIFVGCVEIFVNDSNGRKYMRYPFKVENYELLSTFGTVKQPHQYDWRDGAVVGLSNGQIYGWEIPNLVVKEMKGQGQYFAFARMLLSGISIPAFKILAQRKWLKEDISKIRPDNLQPYVQNLVKTFKVHNITSLKKLFQCTNKYPRFLEKELKQWLNVKNPDGVYETLLKAIKNSLQ